MCNLRMCFIGLNYIERSHSVVPSTRRMYHTVLYLLRGLVSHSIVSPTRRRSQNSIVSPTRNRDQQNVKCHAYFTHVIYRHKLCSVHNEPCRFKLVQSSSPSSSS